mgnify:CR=1 FL=1
MVCYRDTRNLDTGIQMEIGEYLDMITSKLSTNFDIVREHTVNGYTYDLFAEHHLKMEHYILSRKFVIESIQANELCFIEYGITLEEELIDRFSTLLIESIPTLINLDDGHMSTIITGVLVTENKPSERILQKIKTFTYHKGFRFGLKGWVDIRLLLVTLKENCIVANRKGTEVLELYSIAKIL